MSWCTSTSRSKEVRRTFRRGGYESATKAQEDLDKIRALLAIPDAEDSDGQQRIGALPAKIASDRLPIPEVEATRRKLHAGIDLRSDVTVGEWLETWPAAKKTRPTTTRGCASHIKNHLMPRIGHIRLDRLNVGHVQEMFDAIKDHNEVIVAENEARRAQVARCTPGKARAPTHGSASASRRNGRCLPECRRSANQRGRRRGSASPRSEPP